MIDLPLAITTDEAMIRPIMAAMGFPEEVFAPPAEGNRVVAMFVMPASGDAPKRYACFLCEHFHTDPNDNGPILTTLSSTYFTATQAAEFFQQALESTNPINDAKMPPAPPAHIVRQN